MYDLESVYRDERPRALATLIRLVGDFDLAEDALQEAFAAAVVQWPQTGVPKNPRAWLVSAARHKAIDRLRRDKSFAAKQAEIAYESPSETSAPEVDDIVRPSTRSTLTVSSEKWTSRTRSPALSSEVFIPCPQQ